MNYRRRKKYWLSFLVLVCVLAFGVVYAATTGLLNFNGTAVITPNAKIIYDAIYISNGTDKDSYSISADGQTATFSVFLDGKDDYVQISPDLFNSGNVGVTLGTLTLTSTPPSEIKVTTYPVFDGYTLAPGEYTGKYEAFRIELVNDNIAPGSYSFNATLSYEQT